MLYESVKGCCVLLWQKLLGHTFFRTGSQAALRCISDSFTAALCTQQGRLNEVSDRSDASQATDRNTWKKPMECHSNRGEEFTSPTSSELRAHQRAGRSATFSGSSPRLGKGRPDSGLHDIYSFLPKG